MATTTLEKPQENVRIDSLDDFRKKLQIELTIQEKKELEIDFKPFEIAHEEVLKVQEKINKQTHEKVKTLRELAQSTKETKENSDIGVTDKLLSVVALRSAKTLHLRSLCYACCQNYLKFARFHLNYNINC